MVRNSRLGKLGEDSVQLWCAQVGIDFNPPRRDQKGWDALLQFPSIADGTERPFDLQAPEISAFIQVKSSDADRRSVLLKLSTLLDLCKNPLPTFVVLLHFAGGSNPVRCFVRHLDKMLMEQVLRRARRASLDKQLSHKVNLSVTMRPEDCLPALHGEALSAAIRSAVGEASTYHARKQSWRASVGYKGPTHDVSFQWSVPADPDWQEQLADFAIGLRETWPMDSFSVTDLRFGMPAEVEAGKGGEFRMWLTPRPVELIAESVKGGKASVACNMVAAPMLFPFLPKEFWKVRIWNSMVNVVFDPRFKLAQVSLTAPTGECSLSSLYSFGELIRLLHLDEEHGITLSIRGVGVVKVVPHESGRMPADLVERGLALYRAGAVARIAGISGAAVVRPTQFYQQSKQLQVVAGFLVGQPPLNSFHCGVIPDDACSPHSRYLRATVLLILGAAIGDRAVAALVALRGLPRFELDKEEPAFWWMWLDAIEREVIEIWNRPLDGFNIDDLKAEQGRVAMGLGDSEDHLLVIYES